MYLKEDNHIISNSMKTIKTLVFVSISALMITCEQPVSKTVFENIKDDYLSAVRPNASRAEVFAKDLISTGLYERDIAITKDGNEIYYSLFLGDWNTVMVTKRVNGLWQEPTVASFARDTSFFFAEPALSIDGTKIFFLSTKPRKTEKAKPGWSNQNIWFAQRLVDGTWGEAAPLPESINEFEEFYPSLTSDGTLYFCRTDAKTGTSQILRSKQKNGEYQEPVVLPAPN